ncbi:hypothetical protein XELAEV_18008028mg [Xenopus laevis]|uniref:Uncharacterized protein n=1 Tax=Xenopus laevis TaxID=8355 RepID=A0A974E3G1_XENLA|nr:hypothetical protein XELAEV_18008028mg [Xenopus laevis]
MMEDWVPQSEVCHLLLNYRPLPLYQKLVCNFLNFFYYLCIIMTWQVTVSNDFDLEFFLDKGLSKVKNRFHL